MDQRLTCIYNLIDRKTCGVADVGTDHGYIPVALAESGFQGYLYASDINEGPLESAKRNAASSGVFEKIHFQLANGLDNCSAEKIGTIVIAGMGGDTITGILDRAEWCYTPPHQLVLQPMTHINVLRYWLINNGFTIISENLVRDGKHLYQIFSAQPGKAEHYSDAELYIGRYMGQSPELYRLLSRQYINRFQAAVNGLKCGDDAYKSRVLKELKELEQTYDCK